MTVEKGLNHAPTNSLRVENPIINLASKTNRGKGIVLRPRIDRLASLVLLSNSSFWLLSTLIKLRESTLRLC